VTDDPAQVGLVIAQDPAADTQLTRGEGDVTLTVGVAPPKVEVPDLSGMTVSQAQDALEANDLTLGSQISEPSIEFDEGDVIRSEPPSGDQVERGRAIDVYVSTGPELRIVPDVSTGCLSIGGARQALKTEGLLLELGDPQPSTPECPNTNRIVGQDPLAGESVPDGTVVTVYPGGGGDV
jgi:serine/threonine-protein kinase